jgi:hypothetical protein
MDEMADAGEDASHSIEGDTAALAYGPLSRPAEPDPAVHPPSDQAITPA